MIKFVSALALLFSGAACAQTGELWFNAGQSVLSNSGLGTDQTIGGTKNDLQLTDGFRFSFRFGVNVGDHYGHEIQYAYNRTQLQYNDQGGVQQGMAFHQGGYNFLYYLLPEGSKIRPFGTGGLYFNRYNPPGTTLNSGGGPTKLGFDYGAGVKVRISKLFGVRFDLRQYINGKPFDLPLASGLLRQTEISAGFGIGF